MRRLGSSRVQQSRCLSCRNEAWLVSFKVKRILCARVSTLMMMVVVVIVVVFVNGYC